MSSKIIKNFSGLPIALSHMRNILIKGGPGTGKTIISRAIPYYVGHESLDIDDVYTKDIQADRNEIELYNESEFVEYIQIHPSMTYEDIVYGIEFSSNNICLRLQHRNAIPFHSQIAFSMHTPSDFRKVFCIR